MTQRTAVSLFASSGIGDLALRANGIDVLVANELLLDRAALFQVNYPESRMLSGDIWDVANELVDAARSALGTRELDVLLATPPCQGMSKNGQGKLLSEIRKGNRPTLDPRNRLIIPTMDIAVALQPRVVVLENVPEMQNTLIERDNGEPVLILDYVRERLGDDYVGKASVVEFADYGVPQRRQRLITIFTRVDSLIDHFELHGTLLPAPSHSNGGTLSTSPWLTVRDTIAALPALDASDVNSATSSHSPLHRVPVLDPKKYEWVRHTPPESGAFDNQCVDLGCLYQGNLAHSSKRTVDGINRASTETPLYCERCGSLLPRPYTLREGAKHIMKGFTSAYKRMAWDRPAPTLTTNLSYPSSDQNLHPDQNRVLSLYEALMLHTVLDYTYMWTKPDGRPVTDSLIRDSIGESVPPRGLDAIVAQLAELLTASDEAQELDDGIKAA